MPEASVLKIFGQQCQQQCRHQCQRNSQHPAIDSFPLGGLCPTPRKIPQKKNVPPSPTRILERYVLHEMLVLPTTFVRLFIYLYVTIKLVVYNDLRNEPRYSLTSINRANLLFSIAKTTHIRSFNWCFFPSNFTNRRTRLYISLRCTVFSFNIVSFDFIISSYVYSALARQSIEISSIPTIINF